MVLPYISCNSIIVTHNVVVAICKQYLLFTNSVMQNA